MIPFHIAGHIYNIHWKLVYNYALDILLYNQEETEYAEYMYMISEIIYIYVCTKCHCNVNASA